MENFASASFLREGSPYSSAEPAHSPLAESHVDLIGFLTALQHCKVDILPISCQSALPTLGAGAQSDVSQSVLNVETTFAFKRASRRNSPEATFRAFISEVVVLQQPRVLLDPNILVLHGVCWELDPSSDNAWPALVFEKAVHGNLRSFMSGQGKALSTKERLKICLGIATAVSTLHSCNVVHGDVKPENVFIFENKSGKPQPKLADFGFSCFGAKETDLVALPMTALWEAPEWHDRFFTISAAKKTDFYSTGLLFLWVLFNGQFSEASSDIFTSDEGMTLSMLGKEVLTSRELEEITALKKKNGVVSIARKLVQTIQDLVESEILTLTTFLERLLCASPDERTFKLDELRNSLAVEGFTSTPHSVAETPSYMRKAEDFSLAKSLYQLCAADYLLRSKIIKSLQVRASQATCLHCKSGCSPNAAFQLALASHTGFGTARNHDNMRKHLELSGRDDSALLVELESMRAAPAPAWRSPLFMDIWLRGHAFTPRSSQPYNETDGTNVAISSLKRELENIEDSLGNESSAALLLREALCVLLRERGLWAEAEPMENSLFETREKTLGYDNEDTQRSLFNLSRIYRVLGKWTKAESTGKQVLIWRTRELGPEHTDTLTSMANLAAVSSENGNPAVALKLYKQILDIEERTFGLQHVETILTIANVALAHDELDEFNEAEKLHSTAIMLSTETLGADEPTTLALRSNFTMHYSRQGRWEEVKSVSQELVNLKTLKLGADHPSTLATMEILASAMRQRGELKQAEELLEHVLAVHMRMFGKTHRSTLLATTGLANVLTDQGRLTEAQKYEEDCMDISIEVLGSLHPDTIVAITNLAYTYRMLGNLDQASELGESALAKANEIHGADHSVTISIKSNLSSTLKDQERFYEAEKLAEEVVENRRRLLGLENKATLRSMFQLSIIYGELGKEDEASALRFEALEEIKKNRMSIDDVLGIA